MWSNWVTDYQGEENNPCPNDGLPCTCNKPPYECPHTDNKGIIETDQPYSY